MRLSEPHPHAFRLSPMRNVSASRPIMKERGGNGPDRGLVKLFHDQGSVLTAKGK